jgi:hypothetical protein
MKKKKKNKNLHTIAIRRPLALSSGSEESKDNLEDPVEIEFSDHFARLMASKRLLFFKFSNSVPQNGAIQAQPHNKIKPHQKTLVAMLLTYPLQQGGPVPAPDRTRIPTEFRMHNLNRISPPILPTIGKRRIKFQLRLHS